MVRLQKLDSGSYRARVNMGNGKYKSFTGKDKRDVQLRAAQFEAQIKVERSCENPYAAMTLSEAMEKYIESKENILSPKTVREYKQLKKKYLLKLQNLSLYDITQSDIQVAINIESANHAPKTVRNIHGLLSSTLKMFRPEMRLTTTLPQKIKPDIVIPEENDIVALFNQVYNTEIEIPVLLAAVCGMRQSEISALRWNSVDFQKGVISINAAKVLDENNKYVEKVTKSTSGKRTIKMLPQMKEALARHYDPQKEFVTDLKSNNIYKHYKRALKKCCPNKNYTFHELRHYAASVMIMLGIPLKYIADYLGHETEDMVKRVYGHIMLDKKDTIFSKYEEYYNTVFDKCAFKKYS